MEIAFWEHCSSGEVVCEICRAPFDENFVSAGLVDGVPQFVEGKNSPQNMIVCPVCPACLERGPQFAATYLRLRAEALRGDADELDTLAEQVNAIPRENWATSRELAAKESEIEFAMFGSRGLDDR